MADAVFAHEPEPPSSQSLDALTRDRKRRQKQLAIGGVVAVVVIGGGLFGLFRYQDAKANARIAEAWGGLSKCLLGADVDPGESPGRRLRALQVVAMTLPEPKRWPAAGQSWPARCAPLAHGLGEALREAGRAESDKKDLAFYAEALGKQLKEPDALSADLSEQVENVWVEAKTAGVKAAPALEVTGPPSVVLPLSVDALPPADAVSKGAFSLRGTWTDAHPGRTLRLLVQEKGVPNAPFSCAVAAGDAAVHCAPLPKSIPAESHGLRLLGTADDDAAPLLFAGNRGDSGVYRADTGELVARMYSYGGWSTKDGFSAVLGFNEARRELVLTRKAKGSPPESKSLKPDIRINNYFYSSQILWDRILLRGVNKSDERRLQAQPVSRSGPPGEPVDIGALEEPGLVSGGEDEAAHIAGCRTPDGMAVRIKGYDNDFVTFLTAGHWSQPISPQLTGGTLSCRKGEAIITRLEPAGADAPWRTTVTQVFCTSAGCQKHAVKMESLLAGMLQFAPKDGRVDAVELDGKLLVVWAAGERGGVRMRLASADSLDTVPDVILFDDLVKDGRVQKLSTLLELRVLAREGFAVVLLSTVTGVHALRIAPDGKIAPLKVEWGT